MILNFSLSYVTKFPHARRPGFRECVPETSQNLQVEMTKQPGTHASNPTVMLAIQAYYRLD